MIIYGYHGSLFRCPDLYLLCRMDSIRRNQKISNRLERVQTVSRVIVLSRDFQYQVLTFVPFDFPHSVIIEQISEIL